MPSRLNSISSSPTLREYAQGVAQRATQPVADFLAPTVEVATSTGRFKRYSEKNRFAIPNTIRAIGGRATELQFSAEDATFNCVPHALDYPVDNLEQLEASGLENMLMEGAEAVAEVAGLSHERTVVDLAMSALGGGTGLLWNGSADPIDDLDGHVLNIIKAARYGSLMGVGILFGATAWKVFKNHAKVQSKFVVGNSKKANLAIPTIADAGQLFLGQPDVRASFMVYDDAPEGKAADIKFVLDSSILVFARHERPTRRDPSFMKTFRLRGEWMKPGSYVRDDGRVEVAKFDWSCDPRVVNSAAAVRLNITTSAPQE